MDDDIDALLEEVESGLPSKIAPTSQKTSKAAPPAALRSQNNSGKEVTSLDDLLAEIDVHHDEGDLKNGRKSADSLSIGGQRSTASPAPEGPNSSKIKSK
ncbi:hypothetical protein HDV00_003857 [Rhizophlyctis rosea]|nr:hypothetical protein HDV00_003857 [Rhizophlyctis rosea]